MWTEVRSGAPHLGSLSSLREKPQAVPYHQGDMHARTHAFTHASMHTPVPQARELWVLHFLGHPPRAQETSCSPAHPLTSGYPLNRFWSLPACPEDLERQLCKSLDQASGLAWPLGGAYPSRCCYLIRSRWRGEMGLCPFPHLVNFPERKPGPL